MEASGTVAVRQGKVNWEDIQLVQKLIERCLELYMSQEEIVTALKMQANIEKGLTNLGTETIPCYLRCGMAHSLSHCCSAVWEKLQEQNPDFFRAYRTRLRVKGQIREFNTLVSQMSQILDT
eukprot:COSAG05_NODE_496_length_9256_cov_9.286557_2_plen_122_part_00